jgi:hypothetical protein
MTSGFLPLLDAIQLVIDTLDQATRRAFKITKVILPPRLYTTFYTYAIAHRPLLADSPLFASIPVVCDPVDGNGMRFEIQPRPDVFHSKGQVH